jgi:4-amino-4-deoxy-L-arabinose transferase-like glycosyltransferase
MEERFSLLLSRTASVGCLLGCCATLYLLLGLAGYVRAPLLNVAVAAALAASAIFLLLHFGGISARTNWIGRLLWAAIAVFLVAEIALGFLPPTSRDELTHHLAIPKLYARAGRIVQVPFAPYAYYPMLLDMLYTPWIYWGYDSVPKLIHGLFAYLTGLLIYAYLARRMNAAYGLLGFFLLVSMPVIARLSHWAYIDLGVMFYTSAALLALLHWREERQLGWLALSAFSLGCALATKPNGLVAALLITSLFFMVLCKPRRAPARQVGCELLIFGGCAFLPFAPWLIKNWVQTGNPFYPLLGSLFASRAIEPGGASFGELGIFLKRDLLYGESFWQIAALPLRVFFAGEDDNPRLFDGVLTPVLLVFLPWAFKGKWLEEKKLLASFALLFVLFALFLVDMRIRYILPIVPILVILTVFGVFNLLIRVKRPAFVFAVLAVFAIWHAVYLARYVRAARPLSYLAGTETREAYLGQALPEYAALQFVNRATARNAKIYLLFIGRRAYYCERNYFHDPGDLPGYLLLAIRNAKTPADIARALQRMQITHLLAREDLLKRFLAQNLTAAQAALWNQFAETGIELKFHEQGHSVYEIHA